MESGTHQAIAPKLLLAAANNLIYHKTIISCRVLSSCLFSLSLYTSAPSIADLEKTVLHHYLFAEIQAVNKPQSKKKKLKMSYSHLLELTFKALILQLRDLPFIKKVSLFQLHADFLNHVTFLIVLLPVTWKKKVNHINLKYFLSDLLNLIFRL